jgi:predicted ATPase
VIIPNVHIQDFRCFRRVDVELRPLTALVGPNDSGKSAFLDALRSFFHSHPSYGGYQLQGPADHYRQEPSTSPNIETRIGGGSSSRLASPPASVGFYRLPSDGPSMRSQGQPDEVQPPQFGTDGAGLPTVLDYFLRRDRKRLEQIVEALRDLIPGFENIAIRTPSAESRSIDLIVENGLVIDATRASTGLKVLLFFVALAYRPAPPDLILIEEPENGVHPKRLADIVKLLRQITEGKHGGKATQLVLTTHSPYLLDCLDLEKDQVLVFQRLSDGRRTATPADAERLQSFRDEFLLGEVWYNEGESGLIKTDK